MRELGHCAAPSTPRTRFAFEWRIYRKAVCVCGAETGECEQGSCFEVLLYGQYALRPMIRKWGWDALDDSQNVCAPVAPKGVTAL